MDDQRLYSSPEAAEIFGLDRSYVSRRAKKAFKEKRAWPLLRGKTYEATLAGWDQILNNKETVQRKQRKRVVEFGNDKAVEDTISARRAAKVHKISPSWCRELGRRAKKRNYKWPVWDEKRKIWVAPTEQWKKIIENPKLRKWIRKN